MRLPWPDKQLSPNSRGHWRKSADVKADAKTTAWGICREAGRQSGTHLCMTFCPPDRKRRDLDNAFAATKYYIDGIALAMGIDDSAFSYTIRWGQVVPGGAVEVVISEPQSGMVLVPIVGSIS